MKKTLFTKGFLPFLFIILGLVSCNQDDSSSVPSSFVLNEAATISSPQAGNQIALTSQLAGANLINLEWPKPSATGNTVLFHQVQIDIAGNNFANPVLVKETSSTGIGLTGANLNEALAQLGVIPGFTQSIQLRLNSSIDKVNWKQSNVLLFGLKAYDPNPVTGSFVYLAEDYPNWNFLTAEKLTSPNDDGIFGHNYFLFPSATNFVVINPADASVWGKGSADEVLVQNGSPIEVASSGMYNFELAPSSGYYILTQQMWGVIGSATPMQWNDETPLSLDASSGIWSGTVNLVAGELKFRANHDWGINLGDNGLDGSLEPGGANIPNTFVGPTKVVLDFSDWENPTYQIGDAAPIVSGNLLYFSTNGSSTTGMQTIYSKDANGQYAGFMNLKAADSYSLIDPDFNNGEVWGSNDGSTVGAGQAAIRVPSNGHYRVVVDYGAETITMYKIESMAMVGPATGLGWPAGPDGTDGQDLNMTYDAATETYTVSATGLIADEFKFRPNNRWDQFDLGAGPSAGTLGIQGGNLSNTITGSATVKINLSDDTNYTYTIQ